MGSTIDRTFTPWPATTMLAPAAECVFLSRPSPAEGAERIARLAWTRRATAACRFLLHSCRLDCRVPDEPSAHLMSNSNIALRTPDSIPRQLSSNSAPASVDPSPSSRASIPPLHRFLQLVLAGFPAFRVAKGYRFEKVPRQHSRLCWNQSVSFLFATGRRVFLSSPMSLPCEYTLQATRRMSCRDPWPGQQVELMHLGTM